MQMQKPRVAWGRRFIQRLPLLLLFMLPAVARAQFTYSTDGTNVTITGYTGSGGDVTIPDTINDLPVTSIGGLTFYGCSSLTSVTIPDGVKSIGDWAFGWCVSLTNVMIGTNITSIGYATFAYCTGLNRVYFQGNAPSSVGSYVFYDDNNASVYYLPGTTGWGPYFGGCRALMLVPPYGCQVSNGAIAIGGYTGSGGAATIPDTINGLPVTGIADLAFSQCTSITTVTIPNSVTNIGIQAFWNCTSLASVTIPNSVTSIGNNAFYGCISLTNVTIPDSVASIGDWVFYNCSSLTNATIPNHVTSIGMYAFSKCASLTSVTIPNGVTNIAQWAFSYCTNLTKVYFLGNAPSVGTSVFGGGLVGRSDVTVYYLPGTTGWANFAQLTGRPTVLWKPLVQTGDGSFGAQTNGFGFNINWASGQTVAVETCTDLSNPVWTPLATNLLVGGTFYFSDPQWTNYPNRYYRLRSP